MISLGTSYVHVHDFVFTFLFFLFFFFLGVSYQDFQYAIIGVFKYDMSCKIEIC